MIDHEKKMLINILIFETIKLEELYTVNLLTGRTTARSHVKHENSHFPDNRDEGYQCARNRSLDKSHESSSLISL